jgi:hypothetical protein
MQNITKDYAPTSWLIALSLGLAMMATQAIQTVGRSSETTKLATTTGGNADGPGVAAFHMGLLFGETYSSPEIRAHVVTPTGQPVEGAIVVATWGVSTNLNNVSAGQLAISEVITDKSGEFRIPPWGPRYVSRGVIQGHEPTIRIFHPDFFPVVVDNGFTMKTASSIIKFRLQDQAITLTPFHGTPKQHEEALSGLISTLDFINEEPPNAICYSYGIPKLLATLQHVSDSIRSEGTGEFLPHYENIKIVQAKKCIKEDVTSGMEIDHGVIFDPRISTILGSDGL